jgi:uncharacterized protein (DUF2249 family)
MNESIVVDVRTIQPRDRHRRFFEVFDGLGTGESFLLLVDHDPKPLFYQLQAERPGQAALEPQEEGPEQWAIKVSKVG